MDVFEAMGTCRAIRYLKPDPVPHELLEKVLWAATRAPSPGNTQGWDFVVVTEAEPKTRIADALRDVMLGRIGDMRPADRTERLMFDGAANIVDTFDQAPVLVFVCGPVIYPARRPSAQFTWSTCYPAAQNLVVAARALGLGSVFTALHVPVEPVVREVLGIPDHIKVAATIPLGWPAVDFGPVRRRPVEDFVHREGWEGDKRGSGGNETAGG